MVRILGCRPVVNSLNIADFDGLAIFLRRLVQIDDDQVHVFGLLEAVARATAAAGHVLHRRGVDIFFERRNLELPLAKGADELRILDVAVVHGLS